MYSPGHDIGVAATRFTRALTQAVADALEPHGLTVSEYGVLDNISSNPGTSNAELARYLLITPQALGRVTQRLAARGLVASAVPASGRRQPISLTDEGTRFYAQVRPAVEDALQKLFSPLERHEQGDLRRMLQQVITPSAE